MAEPAAEGEAPRRSGAQIKGGAQIKKPRAEARGADLGEAEGQKLRRTPLVKAVLLSAKKPEARPLRTFENITPP